MATTISLDSDDEDDACVRVAGLGTSKDAPVELSVWMCEAHNRVNALLGKPAFPCVLSQLDERWRSSKRPECDLTGLAEDE